MKRDSGWFAAGEGFERALERLSDGAFKVFAYVCLHAERSSGRMAFERAELARSVGKSRSALGRCLRELVHKGVCTLEAAPNQHRSSQLQVQAAYWPYEPGTGSARRPAGRQPTWRACGRCSASRAACEGLSGRETSASRQHGMLPVCPWRPCDGRCCWAVCASR